MDKISILLFSEKYMLIRGLSEIIKDINIDVVIREANYIEDAKSAILDNRFDFLFVENIDFKKLFTINIKQNLEHTKVIILGKIDNIQNLDFFIYDFIPKRVSKNEVYTIFNKLFLNKNEISIDNGVLSTREQEIVKFVALGYSNKEIAEELFISIHTVTTHRKNISRKLGIKTISGITIYAILNGIISINDKKE